MAKRKIDLCSTADSTLLIDLLRGAGFCESDLLNNVRENATLGQLKKYIAYESQDSCELSLIALDFLRGSLTETLSWEAKLHEKRIVFCSSASRESDLHTQTSNNCIACKIKRTSVDVDRQGNISLVLGPSGSGKSFYCRNEHSSRGDSIHEFRVYMYANQFDDTAVLNKSNMKNILKSILQKEIRNVLSLDEGTTLGQLDMTLYAIIDEAGCDKFFSQEGNLRELSCAVKEIAKDGQLVVSGTGLDFLTSSIGSAGEELTKIRMLPWGLEDFFKLAKNKEKIKKLAQKHDVYIKMISNARAAAKLLYWLDRTLGWGDGDENVSFVVRAVAYDYISGNGLKDTNDKTRRRVVRSVLKALHSCRPGCVDVPDFGNLEPDEKIKAQSLVDIHVLKVGDDIKLQEGHHYAMSVTPAITIVLAALLSSAASLQSTWSGFESVVAVIELFKLVREAEGDTVPAFQIVQLDKAYPATTGAKLLEVPEMSNSIVFINGPRAPYADVIAPFRLIQAKHSDSGEIAHVKIEEELKKLGVLTTSSPKQKVFVAEQYRMWQLMGNASANPSTGDGQPTAMSTASANPTSEGDQPTAMDTASANPSTEDGQPTAMDTASANPTSEGDQPTAIARQRTESLAVRKLYPGSLLASQKAKKKPACCTYKLHRTEWYPDATEAVAVAVDMNIVPEIPLTVVFVTNASTFRIESITEMGTEKVLMTQDFSEELVLLPAALEDAGSILSSHVFKKIQSQLVSGVVVKLAFVKS
jgi:hypothetical protein